MTQGPQQPYQCGTPTPLLARIPRIEQVAQMIGNQQKGGGEIDPNPAAAGTVAIGVQMLQVAHEFDQGMIRGKS